MQIKSVGFVGLGVMGKPMATNLLSAGFSLRVHNRSPEAAEELVRLGAELRDHPGGVARDADVVITMLPDSPEVEKVMLGEEGVLAEARSNLLLIDMSTIAPEAARKVAYAAEAQGVDFIDAPVSGGEQGAIDGTLSIMVGGEVGAFDKAMPLLDVLGSTVVHVGAAGAGQLVKAANQLLVGGIIELVSEALVLLEAHGADMDAAVRVLSGGLAGNQILARKAASMLQRNFDPGFRIDLHHKDLGITLATARDTGVVLPVTALVAQLFSAMRSTGREGLDHSALLLMIEELSGRRKETA